MHLQGLNGWTDGRMDMGMGMGANGKGKRKGMGQGKGQEELHSLFVFCFFVCIEKRRYAQGVSAVRLVGMYYLTREGKGREA